MDITAHSNYIRMSPRRLRLIADVLRGASVDVAERQLFAITRLASLPLAKLLASAVANAEQNFDAVKENLYVEKIIVNEGPMLKRSTPRAFGRASPIRKRSAHVTLVLGEREEGKKGGRARRETKRAERHPRKVADVTSPKHQSTETPNQSLHTSHAPQAVIPGRLAGRHHVEGAKENIHGPQKKSKGFLRRLFNRKSG